MPHGESSTTMTDRLTVDLVPAPLWGWNLRSELTRSQWDRLRKAQYEAAGNVCEICGGKGTRKKKLECHELWDLDDEAYVCKLVGLIALCPRCHAAKHLGRTMRVGPEWWAVKVIEHMLTVNGWTEDDFGRHYRDAHETWSRRSQQAWSLDITWVQERL